MSSALLCRACDVPRAQDPAGHSCSNILREASKPCVLLLSASASACRLASRTAPHRSVHSFAVRSMRIPAAPSVRCVDCWLDMGPALMTVSVVVPDPEAGGEEVRR